MHAWQHHVIVRAEFLLRCDTTTYKIHKKIKDLLYLIGQPHFLYTNVEVAEGDEKIRLWWTTAGRTLAVGFHSNLEVSYSRRQGDDVIGSGPVNLVTEQGREEFRTFLAWLLFGE